MAIRVSEKEAIERGWIPAPPPPPPILPVPLPMVSQHQQPARKGNLALLCIAIAVVSWLVGFATGLAIVSELRLTGHAHGLSPLSINCPTDKGVIS